MFSADQLVAHLVGDYILQSDWMAENKTKRFLPAAIHASLYSALFLIFRPSRAAFAVILVSHFFIDRYRLARYLVWAKNWIGPYFGPVEINMGGVYQDRQWRRRNPTKDFAECAATGYPPERPIWLAVWLLILADNILHICINGFALKFL
jgi:ammonia channel protein AmtB